jgi:hypothetical protein
VIAADLRALLAAPRDPVPPGVHPSWLPAIPTAADPRVAVWLARSACAELPALPATRPGPPRDAAHLVALADPLPVLVATGRDQLAFATGLRDGILAGANLAGLTDRRAAIARCAGIQLDELGLVRVGARALAGHLSPLQQRQLALRLPRQLGEVVARELAGPWGAPVSFTRAP